MESLHLALTSSWWKYRVSALFANLLIDYMNKWMVVIIILSPSPIPWSNLESQPAARNKALRGAWSLPAQPLAQICSPYFSLFHFKSILIYCITPGNYIQSPGIKQGGRLIWEKECIWMDDWVTLLYGRSWQNTANQFYLNRKLKHKFYYLLYC